MSEKHVAQKPIDDVVQALCKAARTAACKLATASTDHKNEVLEALAKAIEANTLAVLAANANDVSAATAKGLSGALLDRLTLNESRLRQLVATVREVARLRDPVGDVIAKDCRPNGLWVSRVRVPIGVIAMIYEARPNVTVEASALTLKAGNAVVLRGGSEATASNAVLADLFGQVLASSGLPHEAVQLVPPGDRDAVRALIQQREWVDLAIPRGGEGLIRFVTEHARVPVVQHYKGVCHMYLDAGMDVAQAVAIVVDAKMQRPGVCNALECLLVNAEDAARLLPKVAEALLARGCQLRGDERTCAMIPEAVRATPEDYGCEFLGAVLAVRVVDNLDSALSHVAAYGSGHTEAILTQNTEHAERWRREVDAACVVVNASTRFHDGGELGLGAEIGIATSRLHWRGPMGLESLTTMKWIVDGDNHVRG